MRGVALATEDELSEAVGERLIRKFAPQLAVELRIRKRGVGYLRSNLKSWCEIARHHPVLLIADLDMEECAPLLLAKWTRRTILPQDLIFRIAVRETEAWLLADHEAIGDLMGIRVDKLPQDVESLPDPKQFLLNLARRARRDIQVYLLPASGVPARQGLGYNRRLIDFVCDLWSPERAAVRSDSLRRALTTLDVLSSGTT